MKEAGMKIKNFLILLSIFGWALGTTEATLAKGLPWDGQVNTRTGNILLLSDLHLDPFADPSLVPQLIAAPVEKWESIFESSSNQAFAAPGKDSNYPLLVSALKAAQEKGPYDFAVVTGDYLVHESRDLFEPLGGKGEQDYENFVTKTEVFVAREVQERLAGTPVYFCLGNNDSECGDYMMAKKTPFLSAIAAEWAVLKGHPEAQKTMAEAGYYELPHPTLSGVRLVSINDIYWSNRYSSDSCHAQPNDVAGGEELSWLKGRLKDARTHHEKVQLIMHIPPQTDTYGTLKAMAKGDGAKPGKFFWGTENEDAFTQLMRDYEDTVQFIFAGHTHMDDFKVMSDAKGRPFLVTHICPAVSPIRFNNPGFQVMEYDKAGGSIKDMATYYLTDLATAKGENGGRWDLEYDFDSTYGLKGYDVEDLMSLTDRIQADPTVLSKFAKYYPVSAKMTAISPADWIRINKTRLVATQKELDGLLAAP
jgi:sphingomyelin phosphodiesterase acid-like 3